MRRSLRRTIGVGLAAALLAGAIGCGGEDDNGAAPATSTEPGGLDLGPVSDIPVAYADVQKLFTSKCQGCHPIVNDAIDLSPEKSYSDIVGVPAVEAPGLVRVVAGDPAASFLYLKMVGFPGLGDIPAVGTRMPPMAARLPEADLRLVRDWIAQGAKNDQGQTVSKNAVPIRGAQPTFTGAPKATEETGTGSLTGIITDQRGKPISGAIATLLLKGSQFEDGEEHLRAAITGADGRYTLPNVPVGRIEVKAYAPNTIYVARVLEVTENGSANADFGLPDRNIKNPKLSKPTVTVSGGSTKLTLDIDGSNLDRNYTIAVNPSAGRVFEIRALTDAQGDTIPGTWTREIDGETLTGEWIFLAADETCNVSEFLRVPSPS